MERVTIRHSVETPERYQKQFTEQDQETCRLDHSLYALPGPAQTDPGKNRDAPERGTEVRNNSRDEGKPNFQVLLDVVQFRPEDIIIQIFEGWLLIKAQHGCRMDEHGFISRSFTRTYKLPAGVQAQDLSAVFCHDGILAVEMKDLMRTN
ncbi:heat shock protein beta-3 [Rhinatrema bivittatum]|uniref:heat shock protein beta-3 n=1 Tax=Rhinatrema bivittatum TaxID=194408 RepID=UPI00112C536F|nr:heat shock protein beta-3 [Rhinatrema bivittatum]XP_029433192.1 heat shock protein beta-3 [Rhinatrema bivittatum]